MKKFTIGVDVGGTNVKLGLVNPSGRIIARSRLVTKAFMRDKKRLIIAIAEAIEGFLKDKGISKRQVRGIGMGFPGLIDPVDGMVNYLPNIVGWRNVPVKKLIQSKLKIPTYLDNDVNLITLGEWQFGAGKGYKNLVCMTLGTGVGSGLIFNNALYRGEGFVAGELGHIPLNEHGPHCNCGGFGCFERYVGNKYLVESGAKIFKKKNIQLEEIFDLADKGNVRAIKFWEETAEHIGNALTTVINLLNPRLIIIGGGVSNNYKYLHTKIKEVIKKRAMKTQAKMVKVVRAKLGDDAGIIGARVLVEESGR